MALLPQARAIVTGGGAGLGAAICDRLASEGARVAVLDRRLEPAQQVAARVGGIGIKADVADAEACREAVDSAVAGLGGIDILVNNAGVGWMNPFLETPPAKWDRVVSVNLGGTFNCMRAALPAMRGAGAGSIVNIASISGVRPSAGESPYAASKAGVIALTASAALEFGPDVRVNSVSPGPVDTALLHNLFESHPEERERYVERTPLGRIAEPDDIADAVLFLASPLSRFITGQNLVVDGGITLHGSSVDGMLEVLGQNGSSTSMVPKYARDD
ncbi:MAG: SDR family oxidoreductase [Actinobacteria bacterium]|nr:SDR family oxidoreductase [Actinomycetota bacterium]